ncbi:threonine--tRNA ligase, partial [Candidatus Dojkabacteria bacterium]|nr:threonine--tRNA ligase [Candidatus Dojkabacteria bacterium]
GQGLPVWLPNGYVMRRTLEDYMIKMERRYGYVHALSPHINKSELFEISGHLDFYKESMYAPIKIDDEEYYLKPMKCPVSMLMYKMKPRSYRDLPMKLGELGTVYRYEKSGELHGLQRVRGFTQNDAHIFCTSEQLEEQFMEVFEMLQKFYKDLGFENYKYYLALSDPKAEKYKFCGTREAWEEAENTLRQVLVKNGVEFTEEIGEAAFYGPKLDVKAVNVFGKEDAISTIQVDFNLAERFDVAYVDSDGEKKRPYVIHRALIGSFERFFAFLIEYYAGQFPLWLAPQQVRIVPISEKHVDYCRDLNERFVQMDIRSSLDDRDDTLQSKIRTAEMEKTNYILVVGDREVEAGAVSVRPQGQKNIGMIGVEKFIEMLVREVKTKGDYLIGDPLDDNSVSNKDVS